MRALTPAQRKAREAWLRNIEKSQGAQAAEQAAAMRTERQERDGVILHIDWQGDTFVSGWVAVRVELGRSVTTKYPTEATVRAAYAAAAPAL